MAEDFGTDILMATAPATRAKLMTTDDHSFKKGATLYVESGGIVAFRPMAQAAEVQMTFGDQVFVPIRMRDINMDETTATVWAIW